MTETTNTGQAGKSSTEASGAFLKELGQRLQALGDIDTDLAAILREHVLVASQPEDVIELVKDKILELAAKRAALPPPEPKEGDGG